MVRDCSNNIPKAALLRILEKPCYTAMHGVSHWYDLLMSAAIFLSYSLLIDLYVPTTPLDTVSPKNQAIFRPKTCSTTNLALTRDRIGPSTKVHIMREVDLETVHVSLFRWGWWIACLQNIFVTYISIIDTVYRHTYIYNIDIYYIILYIHI